MAVYDADGNVLGAVYDADGNALSHAYDADGNVIYSSDAVTIRVCSFNVGCFYSEYYPCPTAKTEAFYQRHRNIFNAVNPDLCGMPEWNNAIGTIQSSVLMDEFWDDYYTGYVYSVATAGLTFASKHQMADKTLVEYQATGRYYEKAYVTINGKRICFVNTHLALGNERNSQYAELLSMLENEPYFICVGDFNYSILAVGDSEYNASVQLALNKGFNSAQNASGIFKTWYSGKTVALSSDIKALDNIITSGNLQISNVGVNTLKLTDGLCEANNIIIDHLPLYCDVTIE